MTDNQRFDIESLFHEDQEVLFWLIPKLGLTTSVLLLRLCIERRRGGKYFTLRQDRLAQSLSLSVCTVRQELKKLRDMGLIRIIPGAVGNLNQYRLNRKFIRAVFEDSGASATEAESVLPDDPAATTAAGDSFCSGEVGDEGLGDEGDYTQFLLNRQVFIIGHLTKAEIDFQFDHE